MRIISTCLRNLKKFSNHEKNFLDSVNESFEQTHKLTFSEADTLNRLYKRLWMGPVKDGKWTAG